VLPGVAGVTGTHHHFQSIGQDGGLLTFLSRLASNHDPPDAASLLLSVEDVFVWHYEHFLLLFLDVL
jgi:hypothetical protein